MDRGAFVSGECLVEGVSNAAMTKFLLEHGARLDGKNKDGLTALQVAAKNRTSVDTISVLLQYGADPNALDSNGCTCLHTSVSSRVISVLLRAGADPNLKTKKHGMTALHYAAKRDDGDVVCSLLADERTRVNEKNEDGHTAYVYVVRHSFRNTHTHTHTTQLRHCCKGKQLQRTELDLVERQRRSNPERNTRK